MTSEDWINNYIDAEVRLIRSLPIKDIDTFIGIVEEAHQEDHGGVERQAHREDGPD